MPRPRTHSTPPASADTADTAAEAPSKTRRKNDMHALQALGERLTELKPDQIRTLELPDALATAIADYRRFTKWEAKRRQLQYIGRLMRDIDAAPVAAQLDAWQRTSRVAVAGFHETEAWRDRLLNEADALAAFTTAHPDADRALLARLVDDARAERGAGKPPAAARRLFRELARLLDTERNAGDPD
jgi:ribosome-associated protein